MASTTTIAIYVMFAVALCKKKNEEEKSIKRVYCLGTIWNVITIRIAIQTNPLSHASFYRFVSARRHSIHPHVCIIHLTYNYNV